MTGFFITGTDTGVGKTTVALALMRALRTCGLRVAGMKPVAAGCAATAEGLRNDDALRLQSQSSMPLPYHLVNPYAFAAPVAPHIGAGQAGVRIDQELIKQNFAVLAAQADAVIVEGAGGWLVPLDERHSMADLAQALDLPVILVVGLRLGCLNHALLTHAAIAQRGLHLAGWVANAIDNDFACAEQNIAALQARLAAPLLGAFPFHAPPDDAALAARLALEALPGV